MKKNSIVISEENKYLLLSLDSESIKVIITNLFKANSNEKFEFENVLLESIFKVFLKDLKIPESLSDLSELAKITKPKKEIVIPSFNEFYDFVSTLPEASQRMPQLSLALENKYMTWYDNGWKDGYGKKILNWKIKVKNIIPYLKEEKIIQNGFETIENKRFSDNEKRFAYLKKVNEENSGQSIMQEHSSKSTVSYEDVSEI